MSQTAGTPMPVRNRLLASLPATEYERLQPHLETISLSIKYAFYEPGRPIPHVYFINRGVASLLTVMANGEAVEVSTIGNEGMVGIPVFLGFDTTPGKAFMQVPGDAMRMPVAVFRREVTVGSVLHNLLHRYTQTLMVQIAQGAACNRLHTIEQRCCRWLLMTQDRVDADEFPLTQEFLAEMLGVRRASVNGVASSLQRQGLIQYNRGVITVLNRPGMEACACECYQIVRAEFDRLFNGFNGDR
jgi:CRP-like cAMP-binding protein